jgi:hypothetical protein
MGRRFSKRKNAPPRKERDPNETYAEVKKENEQMEEYYKAQNIMSDEEWPVFWNHLKVGLPTTFRITGTRRFVHYSLLEVYKRKKELTMWLKIYFFYLSLISDPPHSFVLDL